MSLGELTRNAFQSGIPAKKWLNLCKLFISQNLAHAPMPEAVHLELSNSVLVLHRSYPGDPVLQSYLKASIQDGVLPLASFVTAFLAGARSPDLHNVFTLDSLCQVVVDSHYASSMPPIGSVVPFTASTADILEIVQDAMALVRTAHSLLSYQSHHLAVSASEQLLMLLLSCISDVSHISTAQALVPFADASELLQLRLVRQDVRQSLETLVLSLSLLLGDDAKAAREAQMMHTLQLALGKGDVIGPNSNSDISSCGLLLHSLILRRGNTYGSGDTLHATAIFVAFLRWSSWSPVVFYTQLLISTVHGLSNFERTSSVSDKISAPLWKAFAIGRLPHMLSAFGKAVEQNVTEADWRTAMHLAVSSLLHRADLIHKCDVIHYGITEATMSDGPKSSPFIHDMLRQLLSAGLIDQAFAININPSQKNDPTRIQLDSQEAGMEMESYIESRFALEANMSEIAGFWDRVWKDPSSHRICAEALRKRFVAAVSNLDIDILGHLCKMLYTIQPALDVLSLHIHLPDLIAMALGLVEEYDCETVGDPQTAVAHFGDVVLFLQYTLARFHLSTNVFHLKDRDLRPHVLFVGNVTHRIDSKGDDTPVFNAWFKALFDNSEGIEDTILRSTRPKTLLRMAGTLFSHAIQQCTDRKLDKEVMLNGFSYFAGSLLNWTLIGVFKVLLTEIEQRFMRVPLYQEVLQTLVTSAACPQPVLKLTANAILRLFPAKFTPHPSTGLTFDHTKIRRAALEALNLPAEDTGAASNLEVMDWIETPRRHLRNALSTARSGRAPCLDVDQCLLYMAPTKFLQVMWTELSMAISMGEVEIPRRLATYILSHPRPSSCPPLLPIFLHVVLPIVMTSLDHAPPAEQTIAVELLVAIISSNLTAALHIEWALLSVSGEPQFVLGQSASAMARRLGGDLRKNTGSQTTAVIAQRLASSHSFVTNFPSFMVEG